MIRTELSIDVSKIHNLKTLTVFDTSEYCDNEEITNYLLEILPVNKSVWLTYQVDKDFKFTFNSSNLQYKKVSDPSCLIDLPDGVYEFKLSYKPNIETVTHYYHLRTIALTLNYVDLLCRHFSEECKLDKKVYEAQNQQLIKIKQYIDAAEYMVSEKHEKECGIRFYNRAAELIKQFENECGC